ncbi:unnamed protein product, partial [Closterium sp. NIES-64]
RSDVAIYSEPPAPASALSSLLPTRSHSQSHVTAHTSKHTGMPARTPAQTHSSLAHSSPSNATQAQNRQGYSLQHWGGKGGQQFKYELAFCSFPMYRDLNPSTLQVWLQVAYHYLRVDYFVLSDGGSVDDTIMKRMRFHWPHVYCVGEKDMGYSPDHCLNFYGHRKFLVDPRQVWAVQVHRPIEPLEGGVHLTPDVAYLNHFQGLLRANFTLCSQEVLPGKEPDWWTEDGYLAELVGIMMKKGPPKKRQSLSF